MPNLIHQLDIKHLRLVSAISKEGNLSLAAKFLNLTQSALSHQLRNLEKYCDQALFLRHGKRMVLTKAGKRLLNSSEVILKELESLSVDMKDLAQGVAGSITLSTECYTCYQWLPRVIPLFEKKYPNVPIKVQTSVSEHLLDDLGNGDFDIAITMSLVPDKFQSIPLFQDEMVVLVNPDSHLAKKDTVTVQEMLNESFIVYPNGKNRLFDLLFYRTHERPSRFIEMPLTEGILEWCAAGMGIAVMARWAAKRYIDSGEIIPLSIDLPWTKRNWNAVTLKQELPEYMQYFVSLVAQNPPSS
jgi:LysR family transcriptional regulator for metE and metH